MSGHINRRWLSQQIAPAAIQLASANGLNLELMDEAEIYFRLQWRDGERIIWSVDLWPTFADWSRVQWDPEHTGPALTLPRPWTILDAVNAMIAEKNGTTPEAALDKPIERKRSIPTRGGVRRRRY